MDIIETEVPLDVAQKTFEVLRRNSEIFNCWSKTEIDTIIPHFKLFFFNKNVVLLPKEEEVQFIGLLLSGKVLLLDQQRIVSYLETGEFFGYMPYFKLPGTLSAKFQYVAEGEGCVAIITIQDFKLLQKKDPSVFSRLIKTLFSYTLNVLYYQYLGEEVGCQTNLQITDMETKTLIDLLKSYAELYRFLISLDKTSQRSLLSVFRINQLEPEVF